MQNFSMFLNLFLDESRHIKKKKTFKYLGTKQFMYKLKWT